MPKVASILGVSFAILLFWGCSERTRVFAQGAAPSRELVPMKFDEYGRIGGCDHSARLDNFAIQIQNLPTADGYVVAYGPEGEGKGEVSSAVQATLDIIADYLLNSRGISKDRIKTIYAGRNTVLSEPKIELWIAPRGALPPEPQKHETNIETFKGLFADHGAWDGVISFLEDGGTGPPVASVVDAGFADMLKQQKSSVAYIVGYDGEDSTPGAWRRVAERKLEGLKS